MDIQIPAKACPECQGQGHIITTTDRQNEPALYRCTLCAGLGKVPDRPKMVCLCGPTRYTGKQYRDAGGLNPFERAGLEESLQGRVVLTLGCTGKSDSELFGHLPEEARKQILHGLQTLHLQKIMLADEILIVAPQGEYGDHTRAEIAYARSLGKPVRFWEGNG